MFEIRQSSKASLSLQLMRQRHYSFPKGSSAASYEIRYNVIFYGINNTFYHVVINEPRNGPTGPHLKDGPGPI